MRKNGAASGGREGDFAPPPTLWAPAPRTSVLPRRTGTSLPTSPGLVQLPGPHENVFGGVV